MRLALGTAQFGLNYGIANTVGQVGQREAVEILNLASEVGIDTLDTAINYGDSERSLGSIGVEGWNIVTKLPSLPGVCSNISEWVRGEVLGSLKRLGIQRLHAVLLHRPHELFGPDGPALLKALRDLKTEGLTSKIGVSVYAPDELDQLFDLARFDLVQAPLSILDRRLVTSGWADRLKSLDVELHTRSAFLQGLLLMDQDSRPEKFNRWQAVWQVWGHWLSDTGLSPLEACLRYPLSIGEVDKIVIGVDSARHLQENLKASLGRLPDLPNWPEPLDLALINPALWSQL